MKLGTEHREQVYFLAALAVVAGYMVYTHLLPGRAEMPDAPPPVFRPGRHPRRPGENRPLPLLARTPSGAVL